MPDRAVSVTAVVAIPMGGDGPEFIRLEPARANFEYEIISPDGTSTIYFPHKKGNLNEVPSNQALHQAGLPNPAFARCNPEISLSSLPPPTL